MAKPTFSRGLRVEFVEALNELYDQPGSWWRRLVDDQGLFLAVRDNYVNVYWLGCSLLRLKPQAGGVFGEVHYKYLLRPQLTTSEYIKIVDGRPASLPPVEDAFTRTLAEIDALKTATRSYAGAEKTGVHDIVLSNWNVVDIEIALATGSDDETESSTPRVDFAALQVRGRHTEIVFFEAKDFTNPELRRRGDANPDVVDQIETYSRLLSDRHDEIVDSYRRVCGNLLRLRGIDDRHAERHEMLEGIADGSTPLKANVEPRLVVFGFDADQRDGENWRPHRDKLKDRLGNRVIFRGSSKGLTRGISA